MQGTNVLTDYILVIGGLLFMVLAMALVLNPPEAWIKKAFRSRRKQAEPVTLEPVTAEPVKADQTPAELQKPEQIDRPGKKMP